MKNSNKKLSDDSLDRDAESGDDKCTKSHNHPWKWNHRPITVGFNY
jgi:hypothetical protein